MNKMLVALLGSVTLWAVAVNGVDDAGFVGVSPTELSETRGGACWVTHWFGCTDFFPTCAENGCVQNFLNSWVCGDTTGDYPTDETGAWSCVDVAPQLGLTNCDDHGEVICAKTWGCGIVVGSERRCDFQNGSYTCPKEEELPPHLHTIAESSTTGDVCPEFYAP